MLLLPVLLVARRVCIDIDHHSQQSGIGSRFDREKPFNLLTPAPNLLQSKMSCVRVALTPSAFLIARRNDVAQCGSTPRLSARRYGSAQALC